MHFTPFEEGHLPEVLVIYNYYVANTTVSFHTETLTPDERRSQVLSGDKRYKTYVIKDPNTTLGYEKWAHFKEIGHKFDSWPDIASYQKLI
ncbi:GNAT family N-acetyltransferase [Paenibacillus chitinolyticus]|uniref:hypothetical protein n=1 Tax=Paenibacillus chitinolyticus TaxID=79263 RepID=UPI00366D1A0A